MKNKLKNLTKILKTTEVVPAEINGIRMYLAVCFLGFKGEDVAKKLAVDYKRVRHFVTVYGLKLQKDKTFISLMKSVVKEYNGIKQQQLELVA